MRPTPDEQMAAYLAARSTKGLRGDLYEARCRISRLRSDPNAKHDTILLYEGYLADTKRELMRRGET